ncbi:MAG: glycosyltransferase family 2 protein [Cytophaga sp.]|uniref:glycosyltransferase family 2 protein n=1 Tax=Cytophaga sp. TaxID=29535 RepID=UPI003F8152F0
MKVAGFTFIRNAIKYDYPIVEAITSILPVCDEFVVAVGSSEDETEKLILSIGSPKIKIIHTVWDESLREGGKVLAVETDKAMDAISDDVDWCFYIQGDEVVHEKYLPAIQEGMQKYALNKNVEGLLFKYEHFFGSYEYVGDAPSWYRREIRIVRKDPQIRSYKDAQGFRKAGRKLFVKQIDAFVYHYGWVKNPHYQIEKAKSFSKYWHSDQWIESKIPEIEMFDYSEVDSLKAFTGTHPQVMIPRITRQNWKFKFDFSKKKLSFKNKFKAIVESLTGWRIGEYKNYKKI